MSDKIAFNPQDRFVVTIGNQIVVTTRDGSVFGHDVSGHRSGEAFAFTGARAAFNPQDRFVVTIGNKLMVTTQNGDVFGHEVSGRDIGPAFKFTGSKAAFNGAQDRFVVTMGSKLVVITQSGDVFGHDVSNRDIGTPFKFTGSKAAFNGAQDRFVVTIGNKLIVITQNGDVFGHDVSDRNIGTPFKFTGSKAAFNGAQDRFVVTMGNMLIVTTQNGDAFGHEVSGRDVSAPFPLNPGDVQAFDTGRLDSDLPLGGSAHVIVTKTGAFTFTCDAHDSGFNNIDYTLGAVLMTPSGLAFTFERQGHVEGTIAGLPFGTPDRDQHSTASGSNSALRDEFERLRGARLVGVLVGTDTLVEGVKGLLEGALKAAAAQLGLAAAKGVVALV
jgi:hypothetical protein